VYGKYKINFQPLLYNQVNVNMSDVPNSIIISNS